VEALMVFSIYRYSVIERISTCLAKSLSNFLRTKVKILEIYSYIRGISIAVGNQMLLGMQDFYFAQI